MIDNPMHAGAGFDDEFDDDERQTMQDEKDFWQEQLGTGGWGKGD